MRERFGVAWWLEAHAPMRENGTREMRPLDWGGWMRWPEFGLSLVPLDRKDPRATLRLDRFRGDRHERQWPVVLHRSGRGSSWPWPWQAEYPAGTFRELAPS